MDLVAFYMSIIFEWLLLIGAVSLIWFVAGLLVYYLVIEATVKAYLEKGLAGADVAFLLGIVSLTLALVFVWVVSVWWTSASDWPYGSLGLDGWASILDAIFKCAFGITALVIIMAPLAPFYFLVVRKWRTPFWIRIYRLNERSRGALTSTVFVLSMMGSMAVTYLPDWDLLALETIMSFSRLLDWVTQPLSS